MALFQSAPILKGTSHLKINYAVRMSRRGGGRCYWRLSKTRGGNLCSPKRRLHFYSVAFYHLKLLRAAR